MHSQHYTRQANHYLHIAKSEGQAAAKIYIETGCLTDDDDTIEQFFQYAIICDPDVKIQKTQTIENPFTLKEVYATGYGNHYGYPFERHDSMLIADQTLLNSLKEESEKAPSTQEILFPLYIESA